MSKQIHITFHHDGMIALVPVVGARKQEIDDFLRAVWSQFGTVTNAYYQREYADGVVTYQNHKVAIFALAGLKDPIQVQAAVQEAVGANATRAEMAKQLFEQGAEGKTITPSWADS
jgi:hypothetical protein